MNLAKNFQSYIQDPKLKDLNEIFWIPNSKVGVHLMELELELLEQRAGPFSVQLKKIVEGLGNRKVVPTGLPVEEPETALSLVKAWETLFHLKTDERANLIRNALSLQEISNRHCYAVLYKDVLDGKRAKRGFRLHFRDTHIPFVVSSDGFLREIYFQLASISKRGLLFKCDQRKFKLLSEADTCGISLFINDLFRTDDEETQEALRGFRPTRKFWGRESARKMPTLNFQLNNLESTKCHISLLEGGVSSSLIYFQVPFEQLEDAILLGKSASADSFSTRLELVNEDLTALALDDF